MLFAYIDETGDRGRYGHGNASPVFGMAAVIVNDRSAPQLRQAVEQLRSDFNVHSGVVMSGKQHLKEHKRRLHAAKTLAGVGDVRLILVYCEKSQVQGDYVNLTDRFYNYVSLKMYKNILWAAQNWMGAAAGIHTRFGYVKGHDHSATEAYLRSETTKDSRVVETMERGLKWVSADRYLESQAADVYGTFLRAATWPDEYGNVEGRYLQEVWHQIRKGDHDCPVPLGLMSMPSNDLVKHHEWYRCTHCAMQQAP